MMQNVLLLVVRARPPLAYGATCTDTYIYCVDRLLVLFLAYLHQVQRHLSLIKLWLVGDFRLLFQTMILHDDSQALRRL